MTDAMPAPDEHLGRPGRGAPEAHEDRAAGAAARPFVLAAVGPVRRAIAPAVVVAAIIAAAGCGARSPGQSAPAGPPGPFPAPSALAGAPGVVDPAPVDACSLLTAAEVTPLIGEHELRADPVAGSCTWLNRETYSSIAVRIGRTATASGGRLPEPSDYGPTEPGPDGVRFAPGGIVEFVAGDRACDLQLATDQTDEAARQTGVRLVRLVRERI